MNRSSHQHLPTRRHAGRRPAQHQRGASLIEVLVSVLILTVGVLSMAALHAASLRYSKMAEFKTSATQLGEDLADRMRGNIAGVRAGNYVYQESWSADTELKTLPTIDECAAEACMAEAAAQVAQRDLDEWFNQAIPLLPGVGLYTNQTAAGSSVMEVWVAWQEPAGNGGGDAAAEKLINDAYPCPAAMNAPAGVLCMNFTFTL